MDIPKIKQKIENLENVAVVKNANFLCSLPGQKLIREEIVKQKLDRIVIAACSPRVHRDIFRSILTNLNLNFNMVEGVNLREQCSWVHAQQPMQATEKALNLIRAGIKQAAFLQPMEKLKAEINPKIAVIGSGISGIQASLQLSKLNHKVFLIEKNSTIGGNMPKLVKIYPENECALCVLSPLMNEVNNNSNIRIYTNTSVLEIQGSLGNFSIKITTSPRYIDENKCLNCGSCEKICPQQVIDEWNCKMGFRRAIFREFPEASPNTFSINPASCLNFTRSNEQKTGEMSFTFEQKCSLCTDTCKVGAINFSEIPKTTIIDVGAILIATGHKEFDATVKFQYGFSIFPDVITMMQLARLIDINGPNHGILQCPSSHKIPKEIVFIQCVGSRDEKPSGHKYCSVVCCSASLKYSYIIKDLYPSSKITICYIDLRAPGFLENYYRQIQDSGVNFIRGRASEVIKNPAGQNLLVRVEDTLLRQVRALPADLVVLATAMEPSTGSIDIGQKLKLFTTEDGFIEEIHPKLRPTETSLKGVYVCGTANGPKDITQSVTQAQAAAAKIHAMLGSGNIEIEPNIAYVREEQCNRCGECIPVCPTSALQLNQNQVVINPLLCSGCGRCVSACPKNSLDLFKMSRDELRSLIEGILFKGGDDNAPKIIVFSEEEISYRVVDQAGMRKKSYPTSIHIIKVPVIELIDEKIIQYTFALGADGIILLNDPQPNDALVQLDSRIEKVQNNLERIGIDSMRLSRNTIYLPEVEKIIKLFKVFNEIIEEFGKINPETLDRLRREFL